jgi:hypothetical protein
MGRRNSFWVRPSVVLLVMAAAGMAATPARAAVYYTNTNLTVSIISVD